MEDVAAAIGINVASLSRIERGEQLPTRDLARRLFEHFDGDVDLGTIYDPTHEVN